MNPFAAGVGGDPGIVHGQKLRTGIRLRQHPIKLHPQKGAHSEIKHLEGVASREDVARRDAALAEQVDQQRALLGRRSLLLQIGGKGAAVDSAQIDRGLAQ